MYRLGKKRSRGQVRQLMCRYLSYPSAVRLLNLYLNTPRGRRRAIARSGGLLRFLTENQIEHDPWEVAWRAYTRRVLFPWAYCRFVTCPVEELWSSVRMHGFEHVESAIRAGRGVLIAGNHFGPGHTVDYAMAAKGHEVYALRARDTFARRYGLDKSSYPRLGTEVYLRYDKSGGLMETTIAMRKILRGGKIVKAALDGFQGSGGIELEMLGHRREFRTALPLVADMAGASIVPVFVAFNADGRIDLYFESPFPDRSPGEDRVAYAEGIMRSYVSMLDDYCRNNPGNVNLARIQDTPDHQQ